MFVVDLIQLKEAQHCIMQHAEALARWCAKSWDTLTARKLQEKFRTCSRCDMTRYCSKECQRADWKAGHKSLCKQLTAEYELWGRKNARTLRDDKKKAPPVVVIPGNPLNNSASTNMSTGQSPLKNTTNLDHHENTLRSQRTVAAAGTAGQW